MNILQKFLISLVVLVPFLFVASASAEPTVPPSEACLAQMETALSKFKDVNSLETERAVWQEVVDAGCLSGNPLDAEPQGTDSQQCIDYKAALSEYLVPMNAAMRGAVKQYRTIDRKTYKRVSALARKRDKAEKAGNKKLVRLLDKKIARAFRQFDRALKRIALQNKENVALYSAPAFLVYGEVLALDCNPGGSWAKQEEVLVTTMSLWYKLNVS